MSDSGVNDYSTDRAAPRSDRADEGRPGGTLADRLAATPEARPLSAREVDAEFGHLPLDDDRDAHTIYGTRPAEIADLEKEGGPLRDPGAPTSSKPSGGEALQDEHSGLRFPAGAEADAAFPSTEAPVDED